MYDTTTKAWKVTEANTSVLKNISNVVEEAFKTNIGWVLVEDWSCNPRFLLMPERIFHDSYPKVDFTSLSVDETEKSKLQVVDGLCHIIDTKSVNPSPCILKNHHSELRHKDDLGHTW